MNDQLADLKLQIQRLEAKVRELSDRIEILERFTGPRVENPIDQAAIRQKVTYDWQS
jgi:hypothetical protein